MGFSQVAVAVPLAGACALLALSCGGSGAPISEISDGAVVESFVNASGADAGASASQGIDGGACMLAASDFDQSCVNDDECATVAVGNYCSTGCICAVDTINSFVQDAFEAAVAATPVGSGAVSYGTNCACAPPPDGPCCRQGQCTMTCTSPTDTLPACAAVGGTCRIGSIVCNGIGPENSCIYPDQQCCIGASSVSQPSP